MNSVVLAVLAMVCAVALAEGQYYVPRAYYTIDSDGHESLPVPLRRLRSRRAIYRPEPAPQPSGAGASANANANAVAWGGGGGGADANANANAVAHGDSGRGGGGGGWGSLPFGGQYGSSRPGAGGVTYRQAGPLLAGSALGAPPAAGFHSVSASTSVGVDSSGQGYYDQSASAYP